MSRILYYFIIYPISRIPFSILYLFSNSLAVVLRKIGFRQKTIYKNLRNSFPDLSKSEIDEIAKKFYSHFADILVETLKTFSLSESELKKRVIPVNKKLLDKYEGQDLIVVLGHFNNWEISAVTFPLFEKRFHHIGIYTPLKDEFMNRKMLDSRQRTGLQMIPKSESKKELVSDKKTMYYFIADQSALTSKQVFWMPFMNQETAVVSGPEKFAVQYDRPVLFLNINKLSRGHYSMEFIDMVEKPRECLPGEITYMHVKLLEKQIKENPHLWLWTHNRWKKGKLKENTIDYDHETISKKVENGFKKDFVPPTA